MKRVKAENITLANQVSILHEGIQKLF
jgi:hypothetical protein